MKRTVGSAGCGSIAGEGRRSVMRETERREEVAEGR